MTDTRVLPYGRHLIEDDDIAAVVAVLRSDWLTTGPAVAAFEAAFAEAVGARVAVSCNSGTAGLHLAALSLGLGPGDVVAVPSVTFLATATAMVLAGAEVVFTDVDPRTGLMRPEDLEAVLDVPGLKAVAAVHLAGQCPDMAALSALARSRGLKVIEDACHALGTASSAKADGEGGWRVGDGSFADMTVFSLHPVKTVAMGEGGVVTTNDSVAGRRLEQLRSHGIERDPARFRHAGEAFASDGTANPWYYEMHAPGLNYRAPDVTCALGLSQLGKLARFKTRRAELVALYDRLLAPLAPAIVPAGRMPGQDPAWHLYVVLADFGGILPERAAIMRALSAAGIGTQVHYIPVHRQPFYRQRYGERSLPGADGWYSRCLSLPLFPGMDDADAERVVAALAALGGGPR